MFSRILIGLTIIVSAYLLVHFRHNIQEIFGRLSWAERYLGSTETGILFIAFLTFIIGLLYITGTAEKVVLNSVGTLFGI